MIENIGKKAKSKMPKCYFLCINAIGCTRKFHKIVKIVSKVVVGLIIIV